MQKMSGESIDALGERQGDIPANRKRSHESQLDESDGSTKQVKTLSRKIKKPRRGSSGVVSPGDSAAAAVHFPAEMAPTAARDDSGSLSGSPEDQGRASRLDIQPQPVRPSVLHPGIICRSCEKPVYDVHYRCKKCRRWKLCQACVWLLPLHVQHHPEHFFVPYEFLRNANTFYIAPLPSVTLARSRPLVAISGENIRVSWKYVPWRYRDIGLRHLRSGYDQSCVDIPKIAMERFKVDLTDMSAMTNRATIWGLVQVASSGVLSEHDLFRSSGPGTCYTITPPWRSSVPLQWVHVGPGAIPNTLADIPCSSLSMGELLAYLNDILGTPYTLDIPGLQLCLEHAHHTLPDLGQLYGTLRPWWTGDFTQTLSRIIARRDEVQRKRDEAIDRSCIQNSQIPPRRVWDLLSNRVLPFHILPPPKRDNFDLPENLWTVSHSWVDEKDRAGVMTAINGRQWPVPIPRQTTLDHIRVELLNMGAEYVWLDVLCLRQEGSVDENRRLEEWKLDVPTIGHIFQASRGPCITYFNGLSLPLDTSPATLQSIRHWSKRVWTLQESLNTWLPGGLTADPGADSSKVFDGLNGLLKQSRVSPAIFEDLRTRHCTTELDRIAGLAYKLGSKTLPLYDRTAPVEYAWTLLIKHMDAEERTLFFLRYAPDAPFGLWRSWEGLLTSESALRSPRITGSEALQLVDELQLYTDAPGQYHHTGYALGPCHITRSAKTLHLHFEDATNPVTMRIIAGNGIFLPTVAYTLLGLGSRGKQHWVAMEVVGERQVQGEATLEAVKWGVFYVSRKEAVQLVKLEGHDHTRVIYLSSEEALKRSNHVDEYMKAFEEARDGKGENTT